MIMTVYALFSDVSFVVLFGLEAFIKIFAWGFVLYIKKPSNALDFTIVVTSALELIL